MMGAVPKFAAGARHPPTIANAIPHLAANLLHRPNTGDFGAVFSICGGDRLPHRGRGTRGGRGAAGSGRSGGARRQLAGHPTGRGSDAANKQDHPVIGLMYSDVQAYCVLHVAGILTPAVKQQRSIR